MKIKLTEKQINAVKVELNSILDKEIALRIKQETEDVCGWDFVQIESEKALYNDMLETKMIETNNCL